MTDVPAVPPMKVLMPPREPVRATTTARLLCVGIALGCIGLLATAAYLSPDPAGVGTTSRLGIPTCGFLDRTGLPCAGCGMTTAFSHAVRWEWISAFIVQPFAALMAIAAAITIWTSGYIAVTARPVHRLISRAATGRGGTIAIVVVALGIASWGWKLAWVLLIESS
ncbi:MAG: DUF2752 domain-containing protein [Planctomycetota bacterium]